MIEFTIGVAGYRTHVRVLFESTRSFCAEYLCEDEAEFQLEITETDIAFERERSARTDMTEGRAVRNFPDAYLETLALQRKLAEKLLECDVLLFHGSVVAVDEEAYLFAAKSGTGKSTHTRLWREAFGDRAVMINDDKPFLRMENGRVTAYGSPWKGKHGLGMNVGAPLKAICILTRGVENEIHAVDPAEVLPIVMQQSQRPMKQCNFPKYMELIDALIGGVAFYQLSCNMNPEAARVAYEGMNQNDAESKKGSNV